MALLLPWTVSILIARNAKVLEPAAGRWHTVPRATRIPDAQPYGAAHWQWTDAAGRRFVVHERFLVEA